MIARATEKDKQRQSWSDKTLAPFRPASSPVRRLFSHARIRGLTLGVRTCMKRSILTETQGLCVREASDMFLWQGKVTQTEACTERSPTRSRRAASRQQTQTQQLAKKKVCTKLEYSCEEACARPPFRPPTFQMQAVFRQGFSKTFAKLSRKISVSVIS